MKKIGLILLGLVVGIGITKIFWANVRYEVIDEESVAVKVVEKSSPSVITVSTGKDVGTGFIISADGLVVTNKHVVYDLTAKYKIILNKNEEVEVKEIYRDPENDLAILRVEKNGLIPVTMGDSDKIKIGQTVIAIGTALGEFRSTVTKGVISGVGRGITAGNGFEGSERLTNVIQTDAAINPGNSGGPLFNTNGEVIGVNVATSQSGQGISFSIPINIVKDSINNFKATGEFDRPYLGIGYQETARGGYVRTVTAGSPSEISGIKIDDIITEIDGNKVNQDFSIVNYINKKKIGDTIQVKFLRQDKSFTVEVKLEKRK